jgi:hypothetical protein
MVLSPRSLSYATHTLSSLLANALEPIHLHLITDSGDDRQALAGEMEKYGSGRHQWSVFAKDDLKDREEAMLAGYPHLRAFRDGHPCWRKITDPVLLSAPGEEMVLLDPDLYFPNRFTFEATPAAGLLLMWQRPNCLLPQEVVDRVFENNIPLAHHVDIGVAHWRAAVDLDWLEWLLQRLGSPGLPRFMHIEAIVWAAMAIHIGGGYLPPEQWHCWHRTQFKRAFRKVGASGTQMLHLEPFSSIKCFHAGGEAKNWLAEAKSQKWMNTLNLLDRPGRILPFVELTRSVYQREQKLKGWLKRLGYYRMFQSSY